MTKIDIFSGFLGAGKTTLIKKLIKEAYIGEKVVLIENEFGEIGIDGGFLQDAGINITEMNSGCICCSLVGDFAKALKKVSTEYSPDRIIIEPSGVGKLSDIIKAVENANLKNTILNSFCTVVDAGKCKMYMKNFGEFFLDQVKNAGSIVLSHTDGISEDKLSSCAASLKEINSTATFIVAPWSQLDGKTILAAMEKKDSLQAELDRLAADYEAHDDEEEHECCHHHDDEEEHECCHHHDDEEEHECCHHHDDEEEHECCHHHDEEEHECCHHHDEEEEHEHHHHHHHADEIFTSWGMETTHKFTKEELEKILSELTKEEKYGTVLRAKGIVRGEEKWIHFDYVPSEPDVRYGLASVNGRFCVIGCKLKEDALKELFKA